MKRLLLFFLVCHAAHAHDIPVMDMQELFDCDYDQLTEEQKQVITHVWEDIMADPVFAQPGECCGHCQVCQRTTGE